MRGNRGLTVHPLHLPPLEMDAFRSLGTHMSRPNEINWPSNLPMMTLLEEEKDCKSNNKFLFRAHLQNTDLKTL